MSRATLGTGAIVLVAILAGCGGGGGSALPELETAYDVVRDARMVQIGEDVQRNPEYILEDYHEIVGVVQNPTEVTAYAVSVIVTVRSLAGEIVHEEPIDLGEIAPGEERSFEYRWYSEKDAEIDVRAVASEPPTVGE